jgi:hypothetical protein
MKTTPFSFINCDNRIVDLSPWIGSAAPSITGHDKPVTREELAVVCSQQSRRCALIRALNAMNNAGEKNELRDICKNYLIQ